MAVMNAMREQQLADGRTRKRNELGDAALDLVRRAIADEDADFPDAPDSPLITEARALIAKLDALTTAA
jgi:hypothetical protein